MTAPAGPVIVSGKTNDNSAGPPFGPLMLNCPLLTGSVRSTTVGTPGRTVPKVTPRPPVMVSGLPCECSRPPISSTHLPRLVDHRHVDGTSIDTSSLVRRGLHLRPHPHKQIPRAAERR